MQAFPDLASLSDAELKQLIDDLLEEESHVSYRRRVLQGEIDILRATQEGLLGEPLTEGNRP